MMDSITVKIPAEDVSKADISITATKVLNSTGNGLSSFRCLDVSGNLKKQMKLTLTIARMHEQWIADELIQFSFSESPDDKNQDWQLAVVLADKLVRGVISMEAEEIYAFGQLSLRVDSDDLPDISGQSVRSLARLQTLQQSIPSNSGMLTAIVMPEFALGIPSISQQPQDSQLESTGQIGQKSQTGEIWHALHVLHDLGVVIKQLSSFDNLLGHPSRQMLFRSAEVWFPVIASEGSQATALASVKVSIRPLSLRCAESREGDKDVDAAAQSSELANDGIEKVTLVSKEFYDVPLKSEIEKLLTQLRTLEHNQEQYALGQWQTQVEFSSAFTGTSYQLALALADKMARGRLVPATKRILATGAIDASSFPAKVALEPVSVAEKMALFQAEASEGDRVLLPGNWTTLPEVKASQQKRKLPVGCSYAHIAELI